MESVNKLLYYIVGLIFFMSGILLTMQFVEIEEKRENFVIEDQTKKSAVELNVAASGGSRVLTSSEVLTNVISHEKNLIVAVNGINIPEEKRYAANSRYESIRSMIPEGTYEAIYTYDEKGYVISVNYNRIS